MFRHVGNGLRPHHRCPDHSVLPHGAHVGAGERPSADQPLGMDAVAAASTLRGRVAAGGSGRGETGPRFHHPGRQTQRQQGLHEEVSTGLH